MNRNRLLVAGLSLLLGLPGCSEDTKVINAVGSYAPVITGVSVDREPAVRGQQNELTLRVTNVNGVPLVYHWRAADGVLVDSTAQTVTWTAPDTIGTFTIYASITGTDVNGQSYFREETFPIYVDNEFTRWTTGEAVRLDVAPQLTQAVGPGKPLVYAEMENPSTGESRVLALDAPMGTPTSLTDPFFAATGPSISADGNWLAFAGRARQADPGNSIYTIPAVGAGADTTTALPIARYRTGTATMLANPRFSRGSTLLVYTSDSLSTGTPQIYLRDGTNLSIGPRRLSFEFFRTYWLPAWSPADTSVLCEKYQNFNTASQSHQGLFTVSTNPPVPPPFQLPGTPWLNIPGSECDWSADGQYVTYARPNSAGDRDIWLIRFNASDANTAVQVTSGPADDGHPRFSHDGNTIYFLSNRADRYGMNSVFGTQRRGYNIWSVRAFDRPQ